MNFASGTIADFEGFAQGKSKKLQEVNGTKGSVRCAAELQGVASASFINHRHYTTSSFICLWFRWISVLHRQMETRFGCRSNSILI